MPLREETLGLQHPTIHALPRVGEQLSFLHLSRARIIQDDTGVVALVKEDDALRRIQLPTASLAVVLLGPGTSITRSALSTITRHGTAVIWGGEEGTRTHGWAYALTSSARWIEAQAALWADPGRRTAVAIAMYEQRFGGLPPGGKLTLNRLRGLEGQRMRQIYALHAKKNKVTFKREYDPERFDTSDTINQSLSAANAALYGVCLAATTALGCHPGLGFVHAGNISSFVFDIADLYKAEIAIPAAFASANDPDPAGTARRRVRDAIVRHRLLPRVIEDIQRLLAPGLRAATPSEMALRDDVGFVPGGLNYADSILDDDDEQTADDDPAQSWPQ